MVKLDEIRVVWVKNTEIGVFKRNISVVDELHKIACVLNRR